MEQKKKVHWCSFGYHVAIFKPLFVMFGVISKINIHNELKRLLKYLSLFNYLSMLDWIFFKTIKIEGREDP